MTDLKALRMEIAYRVAEKANECCYRSDGYEDGIAAAIEAALLQYAEACLGEPPSDAMVKASHGVYGARSKFRHMALQRLKEIK